MALIGCLHLPLLLVSLVLLCSCALWQCVLVTAAAADNGTASDSLLEQRRILTAFEKGIVEDPNRALTTWRAASPDVCSWKGVACAADGHVVALSLPGQGLGGTISPLLFDLTFLKHLNLSSNNLNGSFQIPDVLGPAGNHSATAASAGVVNQLVVLDLSFNFLSGALPASIGRLVHLQVLRLTANDFTGPIPPQLGSCHELSSLELGRAASTPDGYLGMNGINGTIPDALANCSALVLLSLCFTQLNGSIPAWLGELEKLQVLELRDNRLEGHIPASLGNLTSLTYLDLVNNVGLRGEVPRELGLCSKLTFLYLGMTIDFSNTAIATRNEMSGKLETVHAQVLSNLTGLQKLFIVGTQIGGSIPEELGSLGSLVSLDLSANLLEGVIPRTLGNLTHLEFLNLFWNDFTGTIPPELGQCSRLGVLALGMSSYLGRRYLDGTGGIFQSSRMSGVIPEELGRLPLLTQLVVRYTRIGGEIPSFRNASSLRDFNLDNNILTGGVPTDLPDTLETLVLCNNRLTGQIPPTIGNLSSLLVLDLSQLDGVEGKIPPDIGFCTKLQVLFLGGGGPQISLIAGNIPKVLGQLSQLQYLAIRGTHLSGSIPSALGNCTSLKQLALTDNGLFGGLPEVISNFTNLDSLLLSMNRLEGPLSAVNWSMLKALSFVVLSGNNFSSPIPATFGMASSLGVLIVSGGNLMGGIPPALRNCSQLELVNLQRNRLGGDIGDALDVLSGIGDGMTRSSSNIQVIMLSGNKFQGELPSWMGNRFKRLTLLALGENMIQGPIPSSLSSLMGLQHPIDASPDNYMYLFASQTLSPPISLYLKNITTVFYSLPRSITVIDLSNNMLTGEIPSEMADMLGLRYLNLSHNNLSGPTPSTFSSFSSLLQMDFSNNNLVGSIPPGFVALSNLEYVDFSYNNLDGPIPFGTRFRDISFLGNAHLCGEVLNVPCSLPAAPPLNLVPLSLPDEVWQEPSVPWSWVGFIIGSMVSFLVALVLFLSTSKGLYYIFGDTEVPLYIRKHGLYTSP